MFNLRLFVGLYANFPLLTEGSVRFGFGSAEPLPRDSASVRFGKNPVRSYTNFGFGESYHLMISALIKSQGPLKYMDV